MKTVVAAPYPTMPGHESEATFALVRSLVDGGESVVVVSPRPSAAHHHADPGSPRGAARLWGLVGGNDRLVLRLDAGALAAGADPPAALPARLALAATVRGAARAELLLDRVPASVSKAWVRLVVAPAESVRVASEPERDSLVGAGADPERVAVDPSMAPSSVATSPDAVIDLDGRLPAGADAASVERHLRALAAAERSKRGAAAAGAHAASAPLRGVVPLERPTELSHKPGVATVKRLQLRLLGWMFDAVAGHVNRLQQAAIDAVDRAAPPQRGAGDSDSAS